MISKIITTLDNCDKEPIHIPGSIQNFGYLLVIEPATLKISSLSENFADILKQSTDDLIGLEVNGLFDEQFIGKLKSLLIDGRGKLVDPVLTKIRSSKLEELFFEATVHYFKDSLLIELELLKEQAEASLQSLNHLLKYSLAAILDSSSITSSFHEAINEIRRLTNFHRVMLYKFDHEYNGEVIAESKIEKLNSFLHQHFPQSDIPKQARDLYLKNPIRVLVDVDSETSPLYPKERSVDLSPCILRSVSPIHCQYLKNMGVKATMSISIVVHGKLWGLIACHHYDRHHVSYKQREFAQYIGLILSYLLSIKQSAEKSVAEAKALTLSSTVTQRMTKEIFFADGLKHESRSLLEMMEASGVVWRVDGKLETFGHTPDKEQIEELYQWLKTIQTSAEPIFHCHSLKALNSSFAKLSGVASGLLFMPLSVENNCFIMWLRREVIHTKNWGGKPEKQIAFQDDGSHRLMPRSSFKLWVENVKGQAEPWSDVEINCALKFRNSLLNYMLAKSERYKKLSELLEHKVMQRTAALQSEIDSRVEAERLLAAALEKAEESNKELERFAFLASHDLQEPLRKIQMFTDRILHASEGMTERQLNYLERMSGSAERMQQLIKGLLSFSRIERKGEKFVTFDPRPVLDEVINDLSLKVKSAKALISISDLAPLFGDQEQIRRVFTNLLSNALKFHSTDKPIRISISGQESIEGVEVTIKDNGVGFAPEFKEQIFNLFERLHGRNEYEGTGLGLAICKKVIERHRGRIWAESELGEGATFSFFLPHENLKGAPSI